MEIIRKRQLNEQLLKVYLLSHLALVPGRILAVAIFTLLAAWGHHIAWSIVALVIGAYIAMQVSIIMINRYCDRERDTQDKPIPRGFNSPRAALIGGIAMLLPAVILLVPLPPLTWLIALCYLALSQGYNLRLRATPYGSLVGWLAMPLLPLYAFVGAGRIIPVLFWLVPVALLLGVTLTLANSLPELEEKTKSGARTPTIILGVKRSFIACQLLIVASATLIGLLWITTLVPTQPWILVTTLILTCLGIEAMLLFFGPEKPVETRRLYSYVVALTCIVLAGGWLLAASHP